MFTEESMKEAAVMVINGGVSTGGAAERMGVAKSTLYDYVKKIKELIVKKLTKKVSTKSTKIFNKERQVFNKDEII